MNLLLLILAVLFLGLAINALAWALFVAGEPVMAAALFGALGLCLLNHRK
jgi:hypothetical protein